MTDFKEKYTKYKNKYLTLKEKIVSKISKPQYTNFKDESKNEPDIEFTFEENLMTSNIDPSYNFYLSQHLFSYWISSSHNTYLPYNQNTDKISLCYYRLQYMVYAGGCVEIDTYGIKDNDVIISHMITNRSYIKLEDILDIIMKALITKIKKKIISGPFILNFDNSSPTNSLRTKSEQQIFWNTIFQKLLSGINLENYQKEVAGEIPILYIDENFDLCNIPLNKMSNKILFRWGLNKHCNSEKVGNELCPYDKVTKEFSKKTNQWVHLDKQKLNFFKEFIDTRNISQSMSSPFISELTKINIFSIINSQRNLFRFFPNSLNISSGNYDNMKYFRDGVQITAINLQKIGKSRLLNDAVFTKPTSKFCSPSDVENNNCDNLPLSYRLKPLWLLGLVPYPELYNLKIEIINSSVKDIDYSKFKFIYGLDQKKNASGKIITLTNIDVTVPFFVVEYSDYKNGIEIIWNKSNLSGTLAFNVHKFILEGKITNTFNKVDATNKLDDCQESSLLNYQDTQTFTINFQWTLSTDNENETHKSLIRLYNQSIIKTRSEFQEKSTIDILRDIKQLNNYQIKLFSEIKSKSSSILVPEPEKYDEFN